MKTEEINRSIRAKHWLFEKEKRQHKHQEQKKRVIIPITADIKKIRLMINLLPTNLKIKINIKIS